MGKIRKVKFTLNTVLSTRKIMSNEIYNHENISTDDDWNSKITWEALAIINDKKEFKWEKDMQLYK